MLLISMQKSYSSLSDRLYEERLILFPEHRLNMVGDFL